MCMFLSVSWMVEVHNNNNNNNGPFEIKAGVRQRVPSPFQHRFGRRNKRMGHKLKETWGWDPVILGTRKSGIKISYLAIVDDFVIFAGSEEKAKRRIKTSEEVVINFICKNRVHHKSL